MAGFWYTYSDRPAGGSSTVWPDAGKQFIMSENGHKSNVLAARMKGQVTTVYQFGFVGMGWYFNEGKEPLDLTAKKGLSFWYRGDGKAYRVKVVSIHPGFIYKDSDNHFGLDFVSSSDWQKFEFSFASFAQQPGWGTPVDLKDALSGIKEVQFVTLGQPHKSVELWVDELEIY